MSGEIANRIRAMNKKIGESIDATVEIMQQQIGKELSPESEDLLAASVMVTAFVAREIEQGCPEGAAQGLLAIVGLATGSMIRWAERVRAEDIPDLPRGLLN